MCMSKGAPKKPEYGPCRESHGYQTPITWTYTIRYYSKSTTSIDSSNYIKIQSLP